MLYTLAPRPAARLAARQPAGGARVPAAGRRRRPEVGRITGRGNTANLEVVLALKPDLILDIGTSSATYRLARRPRAGADRHSLCAARRPLRRRSPRPTARSAHLIGRRDDGEALARYAEDTVDDHHRPHRRDPARAAPARLLRARAARARDRARRLDQCRDHRAAGAERRRRHARRPRQRLDRAGAAVESGRDRHHRPGFRGERAAAIRPGRRSRPCATAACICRPSCRSAGSISRPR